MGYQRRPRLWGADIFQVCFSYHTLHKILWLECTYISLLGCHHQDGLKASQLFTLTMPDERKSNQTLKSIIKHTPTAFQTRDEKPRTHSVEHSRKSPILEAPRQSGYFQLGVPAFFGGSGKHTDKGSSIASIGSLHSDDRRNSQRVRFLDRLSVRSISAIHAPSSDLEVHEGDRERQLQLQDIQDDPSYLPGFVDLYYSTEITISEDTCCCSIHTSYQVKDETNGKVIYAAEKEIDGMFSACLKFCCLRNYDIMRIGFTIRVFNTAINSTKLLTFKRKTHWFADQLDIVETYYSIENAHVGRIEKTKDGFRLIDPAGTETYRVLRESKREEKVFSSGGTLIVFSCETRKVVAKISYAKRKFFGSLCSMFLSSLKHTIRWSAEIGVSMKTLLLGVLFLELHSIENYVDLPLGRDANTTVSSTKNRLRLLM